MEPGSAVDEKSNLVTIGFALDLTGKQLFDQIFHISAYYMKNGEAKTFSEYVLPVKKISSSAVQSYGVRISSTLGRYRTMVDEKTKHFITTKSEYSVLQEFLEWLRQIREEENRDRLLLIFHDSNTNKTKPYLLESITRYRLTDQFYENVTGFVNCAEYIGSEPELMKYNLEFRDLTFKVLQMNAFTQDATSLLTSTFRAKFICQIMKTVFEISEQQEIPAYKMRKSITNQDTDLMDLMLHQERKQNIRSLHPIFHAGRGANRGHLRRFLINARIDYETLEEGYQLGGKEGIIRILDRTSANQNPHEFGKLLETIMGHFENERQGGEAKVLAQVLNEGSSPQRQTRARMSSSESSFSNESDVDSEDSSSSTPMESTGKTWTPHNKIIAAAGATSCGTAVSYTRLEESWESSEEEKPVEQKGAVKDWGTQFEMKNLVEDWEEELKDKHMPQDGAVKYLVGPFEKEEPANVEQSYESLEQEKEELDVQQEDSVKHGKPAEQKEDLKQVQPVGQEDVEKEQPVEQ